MHSLFQRLDNLKQQYYKEQLVDKALKCNGLSEEQLSDLSEWDELEIKLACYQRGYFKDNKINCEYDEESSNIFESFLEFLVRNKSYEQTIKILTNLDLSYSEPVARELYLNVTPNFKDKNLRWDKLIFSIHTFWEYWYILNRDKAVKIQGYLNQQ
ncbi:MAG: hypothetical protein ATN36_07155 [Epulopiscium sp. Nele67-Bin005]|nr:MAG: hypothetical protein ATN36_07155 [Epulopiscium sp. Nele67-Bin005]